MKYTITINQKLLSTTTLDIKDGAIIGYLWDLHASVSPKVERKRLDGYTWFDYSHLLSEMPLLKIKSKSALSPRINKIQEQGLIKTIRKTVSGKPRLYFKPTEKMEGLYSSNGESLFTKTNGTVHENEPIIILDNNTNKAAKATVNEKEKDLNKKIVTLISMFRRHNPAAATWYRNNTQRQSLKVLIEDGRYDFETLKIICGVYIPIANTMEPLEYKPRVKKIETPTQLLYAMSTYSKSLEEQEFFDRYAKEIQQGIKELEDYKNLSK